MKKNKFPLTAIVSLLLISVCFSCGKSSGNEPTPSPKPENPNPQTPAWDKSKTATVYVASKLEDDAIAKTEAEYQALGSYLSKKTFHAAIIDRSDINLSEATALNGGALCAFSTTKVPAFAINTYKGETVQGSSILLDSIVSQTESIFSNKLRMKVVPAKINNALGFPLATMRIQSQEQIDAIVPKTADLYTEKLLIIGTITTSLYNSLENVVKNSGQRLRLEKIKTTQTHSYTLFILSPHYWLLRQTTQETAGNIPVYCLEIETNVF